MLQNTVHKYIQRRGSTYHFRWRIPADLRRALGVTELTCSLHTPDCLLAGVRAGRFVVIVTSIKALRKAYLFQAIEADEYVSELKKLWKRVCSMRRKKSKFIETGLITCAGMTFDYGGDVEKELEAVAKANEMGLLSSTAEPSPSDVVSSMTFSALFEDFLAHKMDKVESEKEGRNPLSEKQQENHRRNFNTLIDIIGDEPISSISREKIKDAILTSGLLPKRILKAYKGVSLVELLEVDVPDEDRVAPKTAAEVRKTAQGIFAYAVEEGLLDSSPARDMRLKRDSARTFAAYTSEEVSMILSSSFKEGALWKKWLPTLAAYTGARRGELVQLRKQDIKFDSDSSRDYILITDEAGSVKTENAVRQVPLHPALKEMGFLDFVKSVKTTRLFDELDPQAVTKWFSPYREALGIERFDDFGSRKVFHSFRHTFITQSLNVNPTHHVQQVVGHEKTFMGTTSRYTHRQPLGVVLGVVDVVSYEKPLEA